MKIDNKDFTKWLENYSEEHHGLKGWLENDLYLDEVELPEELMLTLIQKWLREKYNINIYAAPLEYKGSNMYLWCIYKIQSCNHYFSRYEEALKEGIKEAIKLAEQKKSPTI